MKFFGSVVFVTLAALGHGLVLGQVSQEQARQIIVEARSALDLQISRQTGPWHLGEAQTWSADFLDGTLRFRAGEGLLGSAKIQVIGSYNKTDQTFTWGWDHPAVVSEALRRHAMLARDWGRNAGWPALLSRKVASSEQEAWNFAALTNHLAKTEGVFRGPSGTAWIFMTLSDLKIEAAKP